MSNLKPLPPTKEGFRYSYCEDDDPLCADYIREYNKLELNKKNLPPMFIKRKYIPPVVKLSDSDRAQQLKLSEDASRVNGEKGYSMVRATHGTNRGRFYYEIYIDSMPEGTAARIGWGQLYSNLQAPLGYDDYGYSWRSRYGTKFHQAKGKTYDKNNGGGYEKGDTVGCMIDIPYGNEEGLIEPDNLPVSIKKTGQIISAKKKDALLRIVEEKDEPPAMSRMKPVLGSKISFYKNGKFVGVAFEDIFQGFYYPSISLYKNCTVSVNFGPNFNYPPQNYPPAQIATSPSRQFFKPVSELVDVTIIDNLLSDMLYILDKELDLKGKNTLQEDMLNLLRPDS